MEYAEILHRCFRCGYCKLPSDYTDLNCPSYLKFRFETFSPGGRMWLLRAWLNDDIKTSQRLQEILFSCATCNNCVEHCAFPGFKDNLAKAFIAGKEELVNEGAVPPAVRDYFKSVSLYGNPYKMPEASRAAWADGLNLEPFSGQKYLLYVGDVCSFDERGQKMARAVASLMKSRGVSFGILGTAERSDGNEVKALGESGLFEQIAARNIEDWQTAGVTAIVTLSPHAYNAIKNYYPGLGGKFQVSHYSQLLSDLVGSSDFASAPPLKVTFHDPCYLGRHNWEYQAPRTILNQVPGLKLLEMNRSKNNALCCGGGGGNFFTDMIGGGMDSPARVRVREAAETGAEILAVACPQCLKMLDDAVKTEGLETSLKVMDLGEIVRSRLS